MKAVGIDLGTTNTVIASESEVIPLADSSHSGVLPSIIAFTPNGEVLIGEPAKKRICIDPNNTITSSKRLIGAFWHSFRRKQFQLNYTYLIDKTNDQRAAFVTRSGTFTAEYLATLILKRVIYLSNINPKQTKVVVSIPAQFNTEERLSTITATQNSGFDDIHLIDEPVATALAYAYKSKHNKIAVYDFGGGTFDLAIVDCSSIPFRVIAEDGDEYLGGDNIDRALADYVAERVLRIYQWDMRSDPSVFRRLVYESELAKQRLSRVERVSVNPQLADPAAEGHISPIIVDRDQLERISEGWIRRSFYICDQVLNKARLRTKDLECVYLAGGSSLLPGIEKHLEGYFECPIRRNLDPTKVVAVGASIAAKHPDLIKEN